MEAEQCTRNQIEVFHILAELSDTIRRLNCTVAHNRDDQSANHSLIPHFDVIEPDKTLIHFASMFYAFLTPVIIVFGLLGNLLSLKVFTSGMMRKIAASKYLMSLATSDTVALLTFVMMEWFQRGLPILKKSLELNLIDIRGMCQIFMLVSYTSRLVSAWLVVLFTVERYFGICRPLMQRHRLLCPGGEFGKRGWATFLGICTLACMYKPLLSEVRTSNGGEVCGPKENYREQITKLDIMYGAFITAIPFSVIATLNVLIARTLRRTKRRHARSRLGVSPDVIVRFELTATLLLVSTTFVVLNLPYFVVWLVYLIELLSPSSEEDFWSHYYGVKVHNNLRAYLQISKTIFFLNYCCNVLLYSVSGRYFRRELVRIIKRASFCGKGIQAKRSSCGGHTGVKGHRGHLAPPSELASTLTTQAVFVNGHNTVDLAPIEENKRKLIKKAAPL